MSSVRRALTRLWEPDDVRWYYLLFGLCLVWAVAPLWAGPILPFQDYGGNLTYARILGGSLGDYPLYDQTYETGGPLLPNGLFFWSWAILGEAVGYIVGGKILLSLYAIALPLAVDRYLVAAGRERRFALLAFPVVYNATLMLGFVSFASGLPLLIHTCTVAVRFHHQPTWRRGIAVTVLAMLTFLAHAHAYLLLGVCALGLLVVLPRTWRQLLRLALPLAVSLVIFLPWAYDQFVSGSTDPQALGGELGLRWQTPEQVVSMLGEHLIGHWRGGWDDGIVISMLAVVGIGIAARRADALGSPDLGRSRWWPEVLTAALLISYLATPQHTAVQAIIASRAIPLAFLFGLGWLALPRNAWGRRFAVVAMVVIAISFSALAFRDIRRFSAREAGPELLGLIEKLPEGARVATMVPHPDSDIVKGRPHWHTYGYHYALNKGVSHTFFHTYYGRHARYRADAKMPFPGHDARLFLGRAEACAYDFLLFRTIGVPEWRAMEPRVTFIGAAREYSLWKLEHATMPACHPRAVPRQVVDKPLEPSDPERDGPKARLRLRGLGAPDVGHPRGRDHHGRAAVAAPATNGATRGLPKRDEKR